MFRKLKRTYSFGYAEYIPRLSEVFPEIAKLDNEDLCRRFQKLNIEFYYEEKTKVPFWIRLTFPFALLLMILMLIGLPLCFLFTGSWKYPLSDKNYILNWFRSLKLI